MLKLHTAGQNEAALCFLMTSLGPTVNQNCFWRRGPGGYVTTLPQTPLSAVDGDIHSPHPTAPSAPQTQVCIISARWIR